MPELTGCTCGCWFSGDCDNSMNELAQAIIQQAWQNTTNRPKRRQRWFIAYGRLNPVPTVPEFY